MPEILDGKNVYDFLDPEIAAKLAALEEEEERLEQEGFYDSDEEEMEDPEIDDIKEKAQWIRNKQKMMINEARSRKALNNKSLMPRSKVSKSYSELEDHMYHVGHDVSKLKEKKLASARKQKLSGSDIMRAHAAKGSKKHMPVGQTDRLNDGLTDGGLRSQAERIAKMERRERNRNAKAGESDRRTTAALPKHLFSGKRGIGKTDRR
ncbi:unnamed protein product [Ambrosiozyma monospora]|uniref:Unnamed protein product n=1 Tax=Ambrosiozyma monospora TaxID=43982 RepID=A0A9W6T5P0_AMBMO|nr:unnamed protein product [Ambrosiozyma monospora]